VTDPAVTEQAPAPEPAPSDVSQAALRRYGTRMRRARIVYFAISAVLVAAVAAGVAIAWESGEISHVTDHSVPSGLPTLPLAAPSGQLQTAWRTTDRPAMGDPQWHGTVVTYGAHTVRGRNARTGSPTWSYTRTDRTVCTAMQVNGVTVAVYDDDGNCDEVTALDSDTGQRSWTRTLDEDGKPVNGRASYQVLNTGSYPTVVISTHLVIYAIDPSSGIDRWTWYHYGCTVHRVVLGTSGALISQTCSTAQNCNAETHCGPGTQLVMRDGVAAYNDNSHKNPDQVFWNRFGDTDLPVTADSLIAAVRPGGSVLDTYASGDGKPESAIHLSPAPAATGPVASTALGGDELSWLGRRVYLLAGHSVVWAAASSVAPTVVTSAPSATPATARITAVDHGVVALNGTSGHSRRFAVPISAGTTTAVPLGTGFLVGGATGTVTYR
jgi:hypothetical protein